MIRLILLIVVNAAIVEIDETAVTVAFRAT